MPQDLNNRSVFIASGFGGKWSASVTGGDLDPNIVTTALLGSVSRSQEVVGEIPAPSMSPSAAPTIGGRSFP